MTYMTFNNINIYIMILFICSFTCYTNPHTLPTTKWDIIHPPFREIFFYISSPQPKTLPFANLTYPH